jgi:hypothetical protein
MVRRGRRNGPPLRIQAVPVPVEAHHPSVPFPDVLPQHEFSMAVVAPKGSGKTTWIANVLDFYAGYFHKITVFSPTLHSDEKWDYVRRRPLLGENTKLKRFLEKHQQNDGIIGKPRVVAHEGRFDPRIPDAMFMTEYDESTLAAMMQEQLDVVEALEGLGATKHLADRWLILFDDLVGSNLFSGRRNNPFKRLNTNHRHHSASVVMVSQAYRELPKTVRTNVTGLVVWEVPNEAEVKAIYEENPLGMKRERWDAAYRYCTRDEFSFMYVNYKRPKRLRIMKNFDQVVYYDADAEHDEREEP